MGVSKNNGTPKSSILIGFSIINHPFWGTPIFGNTHIGFQVWVGFFIGIILQSGDSWMYPGPNVPLLEIPQEWAPREHNRYHGYTVRGTSNCLLIQTTSRGPCELTEQWKWCITKNHVPTAREPDRKWINKTGNTWWMYTCWYISWCMIWYDII